MADSIEMRTFEKCIADIHRELMRADRSEILYLQDQGLITNSYEAESDDVKKVKLLVNHIKERLQCDSKIYHMFIDLLKEYDDRYSDILTTLEREYGRQKKLQLQSRQGQVSLFVFFPSHSVC